MWVLLCSQFYVLTIDRTVTLKSEYLLFLIMVYCSTIGQFIMPRSNISSRMLYWNRTLVTEIVCFQIFVATNIDHVVSCIWILTMLFVVYKYWPCCCCCIWILTMLFVVYEYWPCCLLYMNIDHVVCCILQM